MKEGCEKKAHDNEEVSQKHDEFVSDIVSGCSYNSLVTYKCEGVRNDVARSPRCKEGSTQSQSSNAANEKAHHSTIHEKNLFVTTDDLETNRITHELHKTQPSKQRKKKKKKKRTDISRILSNDDQMTQADDVKTGTKLEDTQIRTTSTIGHDTRVPDVVSSSDSPLEESRRNVHSDDRSQYNEQSTCPHDGRSRIEKIMQQSEPEGLDGTRLGAIRIQGINRSTDDDDDEDDAEEDEYFTEPDADDSVRPNESSQPVYGHEEQREGMDSEAAIEDPGGILARNSVERRFLAPPGAKILAVATIVNDDEDGDDEETGKKTKSDIPYATTIHNTIKVPSVVQRPRSYPHICFIASLIVALVIGIAVGTTKFRKNPEMTPVDGIKIHPTSYREALAISKIERVVGASVLQSTDSPYYKALRWIVSDDPTRMDPEWPNFSQRYIVAYLYFALTEEGPWNSCNPPVDPANGQQFCIWNKLVDTSSTNVYITQTPVAWLTNTSECLWAGLTCDDHDQITAVDLAGLEVSGHWPEGFKLLPFIKTIVLSQGTLRGPLPSDISVIGKLSDIALVHNKFTGTIPHQWWMSSSLTNINIGHNSVSGTLSHDMRNLKDLKYLRLENNELYGTIPEEVVSMDNLLVMDLSHNEITGQIPRNIGGMKELQNFRLSQNLIRGTIPQSIGNCRNLLQLDLHANPFLTGQIPDQLFNLISMQYLDLSQCNFDGTMSESISYLQDLGSLLLSSNKFHGSIPSGFEALTALKNMWIEGNAFTGSVPDVICSYKVLSDARADCSPDDSGNVELRCPCCTICCVPDGTQCLPTST